jgi:hypothetical protein
MCVAFFFLNLSTGNGSGVTDTVTGDGWICCSAVEATNGGGRKKEEDGIGSEIDRTDPLLFFSRWSGFLVDASVLLTDDGRRIWFFYIPRFLNHHVL